MSDFLTDTFSWLPTLGQQIAASPWVLVVAFTLLVCAWAVVR